MNKIKDFFVGISGYVLTSVYLLAVVFLCFFFSGGSYESEGIWEVAKYVFAVIAFLICNFMPVIFGMGKGKDSYHFCPKKEHYNLNKLYMFSHNYHVCNPFIGVSLYLLVMLPFFIVGLLVNQAFFCRGLMELLFYWLTFIYYKAGVPVLQGKDIMLGINFSYLAPILMPALAYIIGYFVGHYKTSLIKKQIEEDLQKYGSVQAAVKGSSLNKKPTKKGK